jgi:glycosyltransferase involved in cell wall biosynthesis
MKSVTELRYQPKKQQTNLHQRSNCENALNLGTAITEHDSKISTLVWYIKRFMEKTGNSIRKRIKTVKKKAATTISKNVAIDFSFINGNAPGSDSSKKIGIYNDSWSFMGGGECHALSLVSELEKKGTVYLIAETDFDLHDIENHFQFDLSACRKLIIHDFNTTHTKSFDIFINACHRSNLNSLANISLYIVNFPHRHLSKALLSSYYFLFNSEYTKKWAFKFWGKTVNGDTLYPIRMLHYKMDDNLSSKEKVILSVGRFFTGGHCKNQLKIVQVFKQVVTNNPEMSDWKLVIAGGLDMKSGPHTIYYNQIVSEANGLNIEVLPNIRRDKLDALFQQSAFYLHAAGLGQKESRRPENFEHFGITVLEATLSGCVPIVYNVAGPAEIVDKIEGGYTYDSEDSMYEVLLSMMNKFNKSNEVFQLESAAIAANSRSFVKKESLKEIPCPSRR